MRAVARRHGRRGAARCSRLRERLREGLFSQLDEIYLNGHPTHRLPGNLNVSFAFVEGESLLMGLNGSVHPIAASASLPPIAVSSGSACTSATLEPSYVLKALGVGDDLAHTSIRFGLGRFNTEEEVDYVAERVVSRGAAAARSVAALRDGEGRHRSEVRGLAARVNAAGGASQWRTVTRCSITTRTRATSARFPKDDPNVGTGVVGAPECGDVMKLQLKISDDGVIEDAQFKTFGCGSAIASSSYVTELVKGKTVDEVMQIKNTHIVQELSLPPVKIHCSVLAEDGIKAAITDWKKKRGETDRRAEGGVSRCAMIGMTDQAAAEDPARSSPRRACADAGLRVKVVGGGCSGLTYKMDLDQPRDGDKVFEHDGAKLVVDRKSFLYLNGTVLDYNDELMSVGLQPPEPERQADLRLWLVVRGLIGHVGRPDERCSDDASRDTRPASAGTVAARPG